MTGWARRPWSLIFTFYRALWRVRPSVGRLDRGFPPRDPHGRPGRWRPTSQSIDLLPEMSRVAGLRMSSEKGTTVMAEKGTTREKKKDQ
jgi:hypothetical protein